MFCPRCGLDNQDNYRFCRNCGTGLGPVLEAMGRSGPRSSASQPLTKEALAQTILRKIEEVEPRKINQTLEELSPKLDELLLTPEEQRLKRIRSGIITASVGLGAAIFLRLFFGAIAMAENDREGALILESFWALGMVPFFIGIGLIINGLLFTKTRQLEREVESRKRELAQIRSEIEALPPQQEEYITPGSVTEQTTARLGVPEYSPPQPKSKDTAS